MNVLDNSKTYLADLYYLHTYLASFDDSECRISISPSGEFAVVYGYGYIWIYNKTTVMRHYQLDAWYAEYGYNAYDYMCSERFIISVKQLHKALEFRYFDLNYALVDCVILENIPIEQEVIFLSFIDDAGRNRITITNYNTNTLCDYIVDGDLIVEQPATQYNYWSELSCNQPIKDIIARLALRKV